MFREVIIEEGVKKDILVNVYSVIKAAIEKCPKYCSETNYLLETRKGYLLNEILQKNIMTTAKEIESLNQEMKEIPTIESKKQRRKANQIDKKYKCPSVTCQKTYGSEASLNLHIKIKHSSMLSESDASSTKQIENEKKIRQFDTHIILPREILSP